MAVPKLHKYMISVPELLTLHPSLIIQGSFHYAIELYIYIYIYI